MSLGFDFSRLSLQVFSKTQLISKDIFSDHLLFSFKFQSALFSNWLVFRLVSLHCCNAQPGVSRVGSRYNARISYFSCVWIGHLIIADTNVFFSIHHLYPNQNQISLHLMLEWSYKICQNCRKFYWRNMKICLFRRKCGWDPKFRKVKCAENVGNEVFSDRNSWISVSF